MNRKGFTLVEVLVALVVLAVGLLAMSRMSLTYVRGNTTAHVLSEAAVLAQEKMEQLRSYATSERADSYSVFDFNYLVSTEPCFTTVIDPPAGYPGSTEKIVSGLLSGGVAGTGSCTITGAPLTTTMGNVYEVMYDDGHTFYAASGSVPAFADTANDDVWTGADRIYLDTVSGSGSGHFITRLWTVEPVNSSSGRQSFARLAVESHWTDQFDQQHSLRFESLVHQRQ